MIRTTLLAAVACILWATPLPAQQDSFPGTIKKIDRDQGTITIKSAVDGSEYTFQVEKSTLLLGLEREPLADGLRDKNLKVDAPIQYRVKRIDGKVALEGIRLAGPRGTVTPPPKFDGSLLTPLTDMGAAEYQGFKGGLYSDGKNERPAAHEEAGQRLAKQIQPLDADGRPNPNGKIVLLAVGMSDTSQAFTGFKELADKDQDKNPQVVVVNGAVGGMTAERIQTLDGGRLKPNGELWSYWPEVDNRLSQAGVTRAQVQAVWIKQADASPSQGFPGYARKLQEEMTRIVQILPGRFPNLKLTYLSSRTYGGWAKTNLNPEPYAYEGGFAMKWLIEQQLKGDPALNYDASQGKVTAPWLSWGAYLWANGTAKRADGFCYAEEDFRADDRTHQSLEGMKKVGGLLLEFFKADTTTRGWFVRSK